ncbi:DUF4232 domain-containing protein [Streptomyces niveus]|uniref:DUF4232 domain-containing protein n=1 Tax=Streptomyces niveus TaxID=193462 RepID=UPI0003C58547|nr:DUF4232 domain-containing protein [Streptomyces niveus]EST25624.1 hypothetical protein M877_21825 [Streptomyces niveus NCIMB 11891]
MRVRKLTFAALAVAATLSLTACNDEDLTGQGDSSAASTASTVSPSGGSGSDSSNGSEKAGGQQDAGSESGSGGGGAEKCRTDDLNISATDGTISGDTEGTVVVEFKNLGGKDCVLAAYAGVDLKTGSGSLSAERTGQEADTTVLKDGESTFFGVTYPVNDSGGSGVSVSALLVTPPNETKSFSVEWPGSNTLPVTDGSGSSVKVGPMGSAGQGGES